MQKTVTFIDCQHNRDFYTDNLECQFRLRVVDTSLIGTPREIGRRHKFKLTVADRVLINWRLEAGDSSSVTFRMLLVAYQIAEEYIIDLFRTGAPFEQELPPLHITTDNSPDRLPYNLANMPYPPKDTFLVNLDDRQTQPTLKSCLEDFASYLQSEKRMTFWQLDKPKHHKWISHPETKAKDLLHTFVVGKFGNDMLTFEEITAGAGRVDIYVVTPALE